MPESLTQLMGMKIVKMDCKRCGGVFDSSEFANGKMSRLIKLSSSYCPECRGVIHKERVDREQGIRALSVAVQRLKWLDQSKIPARFITATFDDFDSIHFPNVFRVAKLFAKEFRYSDSRGQRSLYLYSQLPTLGIGKTYLAASITHAIVDNWNGEGWDACSSIDCPVLFISEHDFLLDVRASFNHKYDPKFQTEDDIYRRLIGIPLLVIDDIGKRESGERSGEGASAFVRDAYWQVIDGRYQANLPMVITANYSIDNIKKYLGEPSTERIIEMCGDSKNIIELRGKSKRLINFKDVT